MYPGRSLASLFRHVADDEELARKTVEFLTKKKGSAHDFCVHEYALSLASDCCQSRRQNRETPFRFVPTMCNFPSRCSCYAVLCLSVSAES